MANTRDWKTKFSIKYYLITFSLNHTLFSAFSARPDRAFPTVFSTQYPRNGNGWAWGRGCNCTHIIFGCRMLIVIFMYFLLDIYLHSCILYIICHCISLSIYIYIYCKFRESNELFIISLTSLCSCYL